MRLRRPAAIAPAANAAPSVSGSPADVINVGETYAFVPVASDPDGDTLTFDIVNRPPWATFDGTTGELSGEPSIGHVGAFERVAITVSDGRLSTSLDPFSVVVLPEILGRDNFNPQGQVEPIDEGYRSIGDLALTTGTLTQKFGDGELVLTFNGDGTLDVMYGETNMPGHVSSNRTFHGSVRAVMETLSGEQINADSDFGIRLIDERKYFVYYIGAAFDMTVTNRNSPDEQDTFTIGTPYGGQILVISDPADTFLYHYGSTPTLGAGGQGESDKGLIPFEPELSFTELESFHGHQIDNSTMGLGMKFVDLFEVSGTRVVKNPQFHDIDWTDVFESDVEFRAGINGELDFAMSVVGFGLFSFDLAETSGTLDVGFDRQQMALSLRIALDEALFPDPYNIGPSTEVTGSAYLNGDGRYGFFLDGAYRNRYPEAEIGGLLSIENGTATLAGTVGEDGERLAVSLAFADNETIGRVEFPERYSASLEDSVSEALDRRIAEVERLVEDLEQAVSDHEFEVSLRGLRSSIPAIADEAIRTLNAIPDTAREEAEDEALDYMKSKCVDVDVLVGVENVCLEDVVDERDVAEKAGDEAYDEARDAIVAPRNAMTELKRRALEEDDASLRATLKRALDDAYARRTVRIKASYERTFTLSKVPKVEKRYEIYSRDDRRPSRETARHHVV